MQRQSGCIVAASGGKSSSPTKSVSAASRLTSSTQARSMSSRFKMNNRAGSRPDRMLGWLPADDWEARLLSVGILGNDKVQRYLQRKRIRKERITWRLHLWQFLYEPSSSLGGLIWATLVAALVIVATIVSALRSRSRPDEELSLLIVDSFIGFIFTIEVLLRCVSSPQVRWLARDPQLWLDVMLLIPVAWRGVTYPAVPSWIVCAIEALGPLRLFKVQRYLHGAQLLGQAMLHALPGLRIMISFYVLVCTSCGSMLYALDNPETGSGDDSEDELDILSAWLEVSTLATVGWVSPNFAPTTLGARLVVVLASVLGLLVVALALTVVGNAFNEVWDRRNVELVRCGLRRLMVCNGISSNDMYTAYSQCDTNTSGALTLSEFKSLMREKLKLNLNPTEMLEVWHSLDANRNGMISFEEFTTLVFPELAVDLLEDEGMRSSLFATMKKKTNCNEPALGEMSAVGMSETSLFKS